MSYLGGQKLDVAHKVRICLTICTQNQHDNHNLHRPPDLNHELLHVVFSLEDKRPQVVE